MMMLYAHFNVSVLVPSHAGTPGPVNVHNSVPNTPSGEIDSRVHVPILITGTFEFITITTP